LLKEWLCKTGWNWAAFTVWSPLFLHFSRLLLSCDRMVFMHASTFDSSHRMTVNLEPLFLEPHVLLPSSSSFWMFSFSDYSSSPSSLFSLTSLLLSCISFVLLTFFDATQERKETIVEGHQLTWQTKTRRRVFRAQRQRKSSREKELKIEKGISS
jgi:hypothetical protein